MRMSGGCRDLLRNFALETFSILGTTLFEESCILTPKSFERGFGLWSFHCE